MTKIGSDLFKIPHYSKFYADSESEIKFSKSLKKSQKPKNTNFVSNQSFEEKKSKIYQNLYFLTQPMTTKYL